MSEYDPHDKTFPALHASLAPSHVAWALGLARVVYFVELVCEYIAPNTRHMF